jgi:hypothetical protein
MLKLFKISEDDKRSLDVLFSIIGLVGLLSGAVYSLVEYRDSKAKDRVSHTIEYLTQYDTGYLADRDRVDEAMRRVDKLLEANNAAMTDKAPEEKRRSNRALVEREIRKTKDLTKSVEHLVNFFERVANCANVHICDGGYSKTLFQSDAQTYVGFAYPYVCAERNHWKVPPPKFDAHIFFGIGDGKACGFESKPRAQS